MFKQRKFHLEKMNSQKYQHVKQFMKLIQHNFRIIRQKIIFTSKVLRLSNWSSSEVLYI